jgi:hypothetical protein
MKKQSMKKMNLKSVLTFLFASSGIFANAQGAGTVTPNMSTLASNVKSNFDSIIQICNYGAGLVLFIGMVWGLYAMVTNNQSARNYAIGFVLGFCFWAIVNVAVGGFM